jgi:hypothetical protein
MLAYADITMFSAFSGAWRLGSFPPHSRLQAICRKVPFCIAAAFLYNNRRFIFSRSLQIISLSEGAASFSKQQP